MIKHNSDNPPKLRMLSQDELLAVVGGDGSSGATSSDSSDPSAIGNDAVQRKHIANIKWSPGTASTGTGTGTGG